MIINNDDDDFYKILNINKNATQKEIKTAYKKLILKYHPDKNNDINSKEMFHKIHLAYQILSNNEKKEKYDLLNNNQKNKIMDFLKRILQNFFNKKILSKIIIDDKIKDFIKNNQHNELHNYVYNKIYIYLMSNFSIDDNDLSSIFIKMSNEKYYDVMGNNSNFETSTSNNEKIINNNNLYFNIITNLDEIYMDKIKEITIKRKKYINNFDFIFEEKKILLPLYNDKYIFQNEGDQFLINNSSFFSDVIISIKCKKHNFIQRINNYDLVLSLPITLYELFNGFKKKIKYFNNKVININNFNPLNKYSFDGEKIKITYKNLGLPYINNNNVKLRGKLFIYLFLNKNKDFNFNLKKYFN